MGRREGKLESWRRMSDRQTVEVRRGQELCEEDKRKLLTYRMRREGKRQNVVVR